MEPPLIIILILILIKNEWKSCISPLATVFLFFSFEIGIGIEIDFPVFVFGPDFDPDL